MGSHVSQLMILNMMVLFCSFHHSLHLDFFLRRVTAILVCFHCSSVNRYNFVLGHRYMHIYINTYLLYLHTCIHANTSVFFHQYISIYLYIYIVTSLLPVTVSAIYTTKSCTNNLAEIRDKNATCAAHFFSFAQLAAK